MPTEIHRYYLKIVCDEKDLQRNTVQWIEVLNFINRSVPIH